MEYKELFDSTVERIKTQFSDLDAEFVLKALNFGHTLHDGQKRISGEPYFIHPIAVGNILMDYNLDKESVSAGFLHDVLEDTPITYAELKKEFGSDVADLVNGVSKVSSIKYRDTGEQNIESLRKMFLAMGKDIRAIIIKLADRLHNMRTLGSTSHEQQIRVSLTTFDIYVPIAERLGLSAIKGEMEDLAFMYLHPEEYQRVTAHLNETYFKRQKDLDKVHSDLEKMLDELQVSGEVYSRYKRKYSIYKKYVAKGIDQIFDILAHRVIVNNIKDCYVILGEVHNRWKPVAGRIKDYIAAPKPNGYQSLHTTLLTEDGIPFEIQIRTKEMHQLCEYGVAAHWKYKSKTDKVTDFDIKLNFLRQLMEESKDIADSNTFVSIAKSDFYSSEIFVFTPNYKVIQLPEKSTPIDFAYAIHSDLGNKCVGAKVNGKMAPIYSHLKSGDIVEIVTSANSKGPSRDWIKFCQTSSARSKIKNFFKKEMKEDNVKLGKEMLDIELKRKNLAFSDLNSNSKILHEVLLRFNFLDIDDLCASIGYGGITASKIVTDLIQRTKAEEKHSKNEIKLMTKKANEKVGVTVKGGADNLLIKLAGCCSPIPGDDIIGFVSRGNGISVHRADCPNIRHASSERLIKVFWSNVKNNVYSTTFHIVAKDSSGLINKITTGLLNIKNLSIVGFNATSNKDTANITLKLSLGSDVSVTEIINKLQQIDGVSAVYRK